MKNSDLILWMAVLASPVAWFINLEANYAIASLTCQWQWKTVAVLVSAVTFAIAVGSGAVSWSRWRRLAGDGPADARARGMAAGGAVLGAMFGIVIIAQAIPILVLAGCQ